MRKLEPGEPLKIGDVVMVHDVFKIRETGEKRPWRWLGIVVFASKRTYAFTAWRVGAKQPPRPARMVTLATTPTYLLDDSEWPDGVWQERTRLIMEGVIDI